MRRPILALSVALWLIAPGATAGTDVSGAITTDTTWGLDGSPYTLVGDVSVRGDATLTIEPGVEVVVESYHRLIIGEGSVGTLMAADMSFTRTTGFNYGQLQIREHGAATLTRCTFDEVYIAVVADRWNHLTLDDCTPEHFVLFGDLDNEDVVLEPPPENADLTLSSVTVRNGRSLTVAEGTTVSTSYMEVTDGGRLVCERGSHLDVTHDLTIRLTPSDPATLVATGATFAGSTRLWFESTDGSSLAECVLDEIAVVMPIGLDPVALDENRWINDAAPALHGPVDGQSIAVTPLLPDTAVAWYDAGVTNGGELTLISGTALDPVGSLHVESGALILEPDSELGSTLVIGSDSSPATLHAHGASIHGRVLSFSQHGSGTIESCQISLRHLVFDIEALDVLVLTDTIFSNLDSVLLRGTLQSYDLTVPADLHGLPVALGNLEILGRTLTVPEGMALEANGSLRVVGNGTLVLEPGSELRLVDELLIGVRTMGGGSLVANDAVLSGWEPVVFSRDGTGHLIDCTLGGRLEWPIDIADPPELTGSTPGTGITSIKLTGPVADRDVILEQNAPGLDYYWTSSLKTNPGIEPNRTLTVRDGASLIVSRALTVPPKSTLIVRDGARLETSRTLEVQGTFTADNATLAGDAVLRFTAGSTGAIRSSTVALQPTLPIAAEWPVLANISFDGIDRILLHGQVLADAALAASSPLPLLWAGEVAANATLTVAAPTELILGDGTGVTTIGRITVGGGHVAVDEGATIAAHGTIEVAPGGQLTVPPTATIELDGTLTATDADILGGGTISFAGGWVSASDCRIGVQPHLAIASGAGQIETPGSQWIGVDSILVTGILESSVVTLEPADLPYAWNGGRINAGTLILGDEVRLELNDTTHIRGDGTLRLDPGSSVHVALAGASLAVGRSGEAGRLEAAGAEISGEPGSSLWIEPTGTVELLATRLELQPRLHVDANVDLSGSDAIGVEWIELWGTPADDCVLDAATPLPLRWQGGSLPSGATLTVAEDTTLQLTGALTIDDATLATEPGSVLVLDGATIRAGLTGPGAVLDLGSTTVVRRGWGSSIDAWDGANVTISETTLVDTLLDLRGATALIADSVVTLGETGVEVGSGSSLTVSGTDLTEHSSAAIDAAGAATVDARGCWWGAPDGPGGSAAGSGDPVFGPVVWDPPATTPRRHGSLEAAFSSTPAIAYTDQAVVLNDVSVGAPTAWSWQLGDGATADGPLAVHTYTSAGTYTVELTVSNPLGAATVTGEVTVVDTASPNVLLLTEPEVAWQTSPASPTVGEMVTFTATGRGPTFEHRWDLDGDGSWDSYQPSPRHTYSAPGPAQITLEVVGPTGRDRTSAPLMVSPRQPDAQPWISTLERQYPEAALAPRAGTSLPELWTAVVERSETGGNLVSVSLNGAVLDVVGGSEPQVSHTLDLGLLPVQTTPSTITWTPFDSSGTAGASASRPAWVLPHPAWLSEAVAADPSSLQITPTPAELLHLIRAELPATALSTPVTVPPAAPFLAGDAGLLELTGEIEATVSSLGSGSFALTDTVITATAAGLELSSAVDGRGVLSLLPSSGLVLEHGFLAGTIEGEGEVAKALAAAAPGLADLADLPEVGGAVTRSAVHHEITAALAVTGEALATTAQNHAGSLVVTPFAQPLSATVSAFASGRAASDHLAETVTVAGAETVVGSGTESTLSAEVTTRARFTIDHLLELVPTTEATVTCAASGGQTTAECTTHTVQDRSERLRAVPDDRRRHGAPDRPLTAAPEAVSNVFAGATPVAVATASQTVALWVGHDPTLPQLQSTGILWSATDGAGQWTEPRLIVEDTRLELQPVAAVTTDGQVVAAWLRVRDPLLAATVDEVGDLPLLLEQLEVVTATFDPGTGQWSSPIALTDDVASDGSLRMTVGSDGAVHLAWLRNPAAALVPSPAAPSELLVSRWSDGSWSSPETAATGLADITDLSLAATGDRTWVLLAVDPVAEVSGDERLDMVEGDGGIWTAPTPFLPGEATPRQPRLVTLTPAGGPSVMAAWMCSGEVRMSPVIDPGPVTAASIGAGPGELWLAGGTRPLVLWQRGGAAFLLDASDPDAEPIRLPGTGDLSQQQLTTTTSPSGSVVAAWIASSSGSDRRDLWIDTIEPGPDLVPTAAAAGPQHNPRVTVVNRGPEPSGDFQVWVVDQGQQMLDARLIRGPFASGEHRRVYFSGPLDGPPWTIVVDATDVVPEADESNNATPPIGPSASSENAPPVASAVATTSVGPVPLAVTVDASRSRDPDGDPLTFLWLLPDTVAPVSGPVLSHTFTEPGQWPITLLVRDPSGSFDTGRLEVTVLPTNGQVNGDGVVDAGDLLAILQHLFVRPQPFADVNGSGAVDAADLAHELLLLAEG